jgi:hypothetical protein
MNNEGGCFELLPIFHSCCVVASYFQVIMPDIEDFVLCFCFLNDPSKQPDIFAVTFIIDFRQLYFIHSILKMEPNVEPEDYDPYEHREVRRPTSFFDAFIQIMKGSIGSGILAMPMAFKYSGLYFGLVMTVIVAFSVTYCIHMMVATAYIVCKRQRIPSLTFNDLALKSFEVGPEKFKMFGRYVQQVFFGYFMFHYKRTLYFTGHLQRLFCSLTCLAYVPSTPFILEPVSNF